MEFQTRHVANNAQFTTLYCIFFFASGIAIDRFLEPLYPARRSRDDLGRRRSLTTSAAIAIFMLVLLQVFLTSSAVSIARRVAKRVPFVADLVRGVATRSQVHVSEEMGELSIALVLVGLQTNLIFNLNRLRHWYF